MKPRHEFFIYTVRSDNDETNSRARFWAGSWVCRCDARPAKGVTYPSQEAAAAAWRKHCQETK